MYNLCLQPDAIVVDSDGDQEISDDGHSPSYNAALDSDEEMGEPEEDEEDDNISGDDASDANMADSDSEGAAAPTLLPKPDGSTSTWKAPTTDELSNIKAASELFKSNAFKLKVEALLPQVRPKPSIKSVIEPLLMSLHESIRSIPSISPEAPLQAFKKLQKAGTQVLTAKPEPTKATNWKVAFEPPSAIQVVGGWPHQLTILGRRETKFSVDLALEMPATLFQEKDYLDNRFFHKRAYFLAVVASSLMRSANTLGIEVEYEVPDGNPRQSAILVTPVKGKFVAKKYTYCVRIVLSLPSDSPISLSRLSPTHSNLRSQNTTDESTPSPHYNNDILLNTTPMSHLLILHALCNEVPAARDAHALLRVWASQRGFTSSDEPSVAGFDAVHESWWALLLAYAVWGDEESSVLEKKRKARRTVGKNLSSYQLFRAVLDLLATQDFVADPVRTRLPSGQEKVTFSLQGNKYPGFIGPSSPYNFLLDVPPSSLDLLRHDARTTLQALDAPSLADGFDTVFLQDQRGLQGRFDTVIHIELHSLLQSSTPQDSSLKSDIIMRLDALLRRGLGQRVKHFAVMRSPSNPRAAFYPSPIPSLGDSFDVLVGLALDPEHAPKLVENGPPAEDKEGCDLFRSFWGQKSELRRFNDGRIVESVVWDLTGKTTNERFHIPGRIARYIVQKHLNIPEDAITIMDTSYDELLATPSDIISRYIASSINTAPETHQRQALAAFDDLIKEIKDMENLPLSLVNAVPADAGLRYTAPFTPLPYTAQSLSSLPDCAKFIPVGEIILQFEQSTRWPDDLGAIQKVKVALLDAVAQGLLKKGAPHAVIAWDDDAAERPLEDHVALEVILPSGFAFRARVQHDRERTLMERTISDKRGTPDHERKRAQAALDRHTRRFISSPAHHSAVLALQRRYASYAHTVRLLKRWFSSHWLSPHVSGEAAELICAYLYLSPGTHDAPASGPTGFARALVLLSRWDFREDPLGIPIYAVSSASESKGSLNFSPSHLIKIREQFSSHLAIDPGLSKGAWVLATEQDFSGRHWTAAITPLIASRVRELARAAVSHMDQSILSGSLNARTMFQHPTGDYDFIIHLRPEVVTNYPWGIGANPKVWGGGKKYTNLAEAVAPHIYGSAIRLGFNPTATFVREIQRIYGDSVVWFYDSLGGTSIGGVWNPSLKTPRPFRVLLGFSSKPVQAREEKSSSKKMSVLVNESGILAEIERLGSGLIQKIEVAPPKDITDESE
ncbi:Nrap protein [Clavulina sp. PMI_390]|nr:Nrap protein [Clavulina sp. PMI_390]